MAYDKIEDLSASLSEALHTDDQSDIHTLRATFSLFTVLQSWIPHATIPSLHTTLVFTYFGLLACILGGISTFMWKRYDIKTKSQSQQTTLENQLLGTGKYAQYVNAAVAYKIYQQEMEKKHAEHDDDEDADSGSDTSNERAQNNNDVNHDNEHIQQSTLLGGYQRSGNRLRARTIRKQKLKEQRENYERYRKRLEYEKKMKRYQKLKEKKESKKMARQLRQQQRKQKQTPKTNAEQSIFGWFQSMYASTVDASQNDNEEEGLH